MGCGHEMVLPNLSTQGYLRTQGVKGTRMRAGAPQEIVRRAAVALIAVFVLCERGRLQMKLSLNSCLCG